MIQKSNDFPKTKKNTKIGTGDYITANLNCIKKNQKYENLI